MSLLQCAVKANVGTDYFLPVDSQGRVVASGYTATGSGGVVPFVAQRVQDTGAGTDNAIVIQNNTPLTRWSIGLSGTESGGDAGSLLTFTSYSDAGVLPVNSTTISRQTAELTEYGSITSKNGTDSGNLAQLNTSPVSAQLAMYARAGAGVQQSCFVNNNGSSGFVETQVISPLGASAISHRVNADTVKNPGSSLGAVLFTPNPLVRDGRFTIPFVVRQTVPDTFNATATITITPSDAKIFDRPNILLSYSLTTCNDDAVNPASITPAVVVGAFTSQTGIAFGTAQSAYDCYANTQDFLLVSGTHYNAASTTLTLTFAVVGRAKNNVLSVKMLGMC